VNQVALAAERIAERNTYHMDRSPAPLPRGYEWCVPVQPRRKNNTATK
jgi:hypothetical protein